MSPSSKKKVLSDNGGSGSAGSSGSSTLGSSFKSSDATADHSVGPGASAMGTSVPKPDDIGAASW